MAGVTELKLTSYNTDEFLLTVQYLYLFIFNKEP